MKTSIVVTSINAANRILQSIADGALQANWDFIVIGDTTSPVDFELRGCRFFSVERQRQTKLRFAEACPTRHYARKNIGYLLARREGADLIVETDDDNLPREGFFGIRSRTRDAAVSVDQGWVNVYGYFSDAIIWPRGLPLDRIREPLLSYDKLPVRKVDCPIQQGLADENPDVDAIYRLILPLPQSFRTDREVILGRGSWCPFNSQNTAWWRDAFPLLYLPAYCSFRMTDIWRSFVAQRIAWENDWGILFHQATVWQERNDHNLMRDFADEVSGYLNNERICGVLEDLSLLKGMQNIEDNLRRCYEALVSIGVIGTAEVPLLNAWISDLEDQRRS